MLTSYLGVTREEQLCLKAARAGAMPGLGHS
jgi:hypothetical protein